MPSKLSALILRRLAVVKNGTVANAINHDESHVSRIASGERGIKIDELEAFLAALGISTFESNGAIVTISRKEYDALRELARLALRDE